MSRQIEALVTNLKLPEAPFWDEETQSLYFVDTNDRAIHRYSPHDKFHVRALLGLTHSTFAIPIENNNNKYVISHGNKLSILTWDGKSERGQNIQVLSSLDEVPNGNYIWCDGKVDPTGKLWAGAMIIKTMGGFEEKTGTLYNLELNKQIKRHFNSLTIPNGLAWNSVTNKFYFIDSPTRRIEQFDYDPEASVITNRIRLFTFDDHNIPGAPDGMTIDKDGNLWVTCFGGGMIIKIDPSKKECLLEKITLPAQQVSSLVFGGKNLDELYVTTAKVQFGPEPAPDGPENGVLYKITGLGCSGFPGVRIKI
ncbi:regucalcin-like [Onthophagus taurus]|uniref:regucalcin-like n=1 Tax=Onthophagus taurus TaxID=166361 RepID=UPI000C20D509|nr:regucalcin-like [Onthophagus taurus]